MKISAKTKSELMQCRPVRLLEWEYRENSNLVVVKKPKFELKIAKKIIGPFLKKSYFNVNLDKLGSVVWKNCDGDNTVKEIGEILGKTFGPEIEPIYDRLNKFLIHMYRNKFILIECPKDSM